MSPETRGLPVGLLLGLLALALLGEGVFRLLRRARLLRAADPAEAVGLRILCALASVPWLCLGSDLTGIPITRATLLGSAGLLALAGAGAGRLGKSAFGGTERHGRSANPGPRGAKRPAGSTPPPERTIAAAVTRARTLAVSLARAAWRAPAAALLTLAAASLVLFSLVQVGVFPPREYDALVGYDLVGKILAEEGRIRSSVFTNLDFNAQCVYPPFTATNQGFWYLFHPPIQRLWVPLLAAGFALCFGSWVRRRTASPTAASLAVFLSLLVPELAFHLTVGQTDLPSKAYTALGLFALADRLRGRGRLATAALWLLAASTARSENVLFAAALGAVGAAALRGRRLRALLVPLPSAAFFVLWNLFFVNGLIGYDPGEYFLRSIPLDPGRMLRVFGYAFAVILEPENFGELAWLIGLTVGLWAWGRYGRAARGTRARPADGGEPTGREWESTPAGSRGAAATPRLRGEDLAGTLLLLLAVSFLLYMPFFYLWNERLNPIWTMHFTFKRGFFRFIPGLLAAFVALPPVLALLRRCEEASPAGAEPMESWEARRSRRSR
ncbi:MAG: hypothetical protein FJY75_02870 [Candidatus Eisenbacteria bacterium]|uniref:Uncharacterized protein n=1 Tax=Eiseniibacteriota bacterium TaxID=2212470 RepID=A0A938BN22_UNCEI|nr:hypothetical protein [Candidatus Eisenbacteria bacterium]